ncbi:MAG: FAD-dependent oxidoreductase [Clostridiales bacterium]|nr:FAD-dependent oxidoreductase [Clostridiales bacterium]
MKNSFDVIVAGGGPAGCAAALAAARSGLKTLIIERNSCLGGMGAAGLVPSWCPVHKELYSPLILEIYEASFNALTIEYGDKEEWAPINHENLKVIYEKKLQDAGCQILLCSSLTDAKGGIGDREVAVWTGEGFVKFGARILIDFTGNALLSRLLGARLLESKHKQPSTLCFVLANVDDRLYDEAYLHANNPQSPIYKIIKDDNFPNIKSAHFCSKQIARGVVAFNAGYIENIDVNDGFSVSQGLILGRKMAQEYLSALKKYTKAFDNAVIISTAAALGIRESYRVMGEYVLSLDDYINRRKFQDAIAKNDYFLDVHSKELNELYLKQNQNNNDYFKNYQRGEYYEIPLRCLIPKGFQDLLVAGRIISADEYVQGSIRAMPACLATGEAAGKEAAKRLGKT